MLEGLNTKYTMYKLIVSYKATVQSTKLNIKVVSPIPTSTSSILKNIYNNK